MISQYVCGETVTVRVGDELPLLSDVVNKLGLISGQEIIYQRNGKSWVCVVSEVLKENETMQWRLTVLEELKR